MGWHNLSSVSHRLLEVRPLARPDGLTLLTASPAVSDVVTKNAEVFLRPFSTLSPHPGVRVSGYFGKGAERLTGAIGRNRRISSGPDGGAVSGCQVMSGWTFLHKVG